MRTPNVAWGRAGTEWKLATEKKPFTVQNVLVALKTYLSVIVSGRGFNMTVVTPVEEVSGEYSFPRDNHRGFQSNPRILIIQIILLDYGSL
jgi:hypothetical protein